MSYDRYVAFIAVISFLHKDVRPEGCLAYGPLFDNVISYLASHAEYVVSECVCVL